MVACHARLAHAVYVHMYQPFVTKCLRRPQKFIPKSHPQFVQRMTASLLSLSTELMLNIIDQLDHTSTSFIPAPSTELLKLSRVCKPFRIITLPYIFKDITLLNDVESGSSVLAILNSPSVEHVRSVHYIGVMAMAKSPDERVGPPTKPAPEHLPDAVEHVLSNLAKFPNLERVTVEFRCAKTADEDDNIHQLSYDIFEELEDLEQVLEAEKNDAFRALVKRSYDALTRNPVGTVRNLEMRNVVAKDCSAWNSHKFSTLLGGLAEYTLSLRGGDNGVGWQVNKVPAYLSFIESLDSRFIQHFDQLKRFRFEATKDGPPGLDGGINNACLGLREDTMQALETLELKHVFISKELATFIASHSSSLKSVRLDKCYSGVDSNNCADEEDAISWGRFFSSIAEQATFGIQEFDVGISDLESIQPQDLGEGAYRYGQAVRAKDLREQYPGRRMFDYKHVDDKYGMLFDSEDQAFERFEDGTDHAGWEQLCAGFKKINVEHDRQQ